MAYLRAPRLGIRVFVASALMTFTLGMFYAMIFTVASDGFFLASLKNDSTKALPSNLVRPNLLPIATKHNQTIRFGAPMAANVMDFRSLGLPKQWAAKKLPTKGRDKMSFPNLIGPKARLSLFTTTSRPATTVAECQATIESAPTTSTASSREIISMIEQTVAALDQDIDKDDLVASSDNPELLADTLKKLAHIIVEDDEKACDNQPVAEPDVIDANLDRSLREVKTFENEEGSGIEFAGAPERRPSDDDKKMSSLEEEHLLLEPDDGAQGGAVRVKGVKRAIGDLANNFLVTPALRPMWLQKIKSGTSSEQAELLNDSIQKMIQLVSIFGQIDSYLIGLLKSSIRKLAQMYGEDDYAHRRRRQSK